MKINHDSSDEISLIREVNSEVIRLIREGDIARDEEVGLIGEGDMATPNQPSAPALPLRSAN